ncbi:Asp/Glu/Hydantoin racemase [Pelagimonas phthalicica]|uniref:Asp/Glu/Hydantoin racemase n=1 Tax=Pelagimonas phthalicica TaxID=1037362 RepID=A0A238JC41_9RHOB|nr:aspartate/glutamate racemase family protein [Pelagimonas phthalicica]TDS93749.1 allantoin racemase [Pelagimonas phthalicica]SMX27727.1 Asp/Glu/Hydantoin racemase [Pelagimonas phthalicica]
MAVIIINPNSTRSMTEAMVNQARLAAPSVRFEGWTSINGPAAIQGVADGEAAKRPLLELVEKASSQGADCIIIGCFDDTALEEAADLAQCPVIGLGQAAYHYAALRNWRFSVVTTLSVSVPILQANIQRQGLSPFLSQVRASEVPVLELDADPVGSGAVVLKEALQAQASDDISAVILGCAGMAGVTAAVQAGLEIAAIDPVTCAANCVKWLI